MSRVYCGNPGDVHTRAMGTIRGTVQHNSLRRFGALASCTHLWLAFLGILLCLLSVPSAAAQANAKNVLVLYPYGAPPSFAILKSSMQAHIPQQINFYT